MENKSQVITIDTENSSSEIERESIESYFQLGNWFWVSNSEEGDWLGCLIAIGSNFVEIEQPHSSHGYQSVRVHFDDVFKELKYEPNSKEAIQSHINKYQLESQRYLTEISEITARLGINMQLTLHNKTKKSGNELMVLNNNHDIEDHKKSLIMAKEVELPKLFEKLKTTNHELSRWLSAESLPLKAMVSEMENSIEAIDDRIFNVSLYSGLVESTVICADGSPAPFEEKLRVMQRKLFMDEESLLDYKHQGMEFKNIEEFDAWIAKPKNRDRILPFQRCIVAMQIRRHKKTRDSARNILEAIVNFQLGQSDLFTYLYIRNGEKIFRIICEIDFDEMIFPDANPSNKPLMVKMFGRKLDKTMTRDEYDFLVKEQQEYKEKSKRWYQDNPRTQWERDHPGSVYDWANPFEYKSRSFYLSEWSPFDSSNVYFDDCRKAMAKQAKHYNHIALIIQGLFDRSEVLHPHPPVRTWEPESFAQSVELIYDASMVLHYGETPDFEEYRQRCNELFETGSISVGQELYWEKQEATKECRKLDSDWRHRDSYRPTRFRPFGNPGPGYLACVHKWNPKKKHAEFRWMRERMRDSSSSKSNTEIETILKVPSSELFNISAYKKGDYLQFFRDPRSREKYLKWAPLLMAAEDYVCRCHFPE